MNLRSLRRATKGRAAGRKVVHRAMESGEGVARRQIAASAGLSVVRPMRTAQKVGAVRSLVEEIEAGRMEIGPGHGGLTRAGRMATAEGGMANETIVIARAIVATVMDVIVMNGADRSAIVLVALGSAIGTGDMDRRGFGCRSREDLA